MAPWTPLWLCHCLPPAEVGQVVSIKARAQWLLACSSPVCRGMHPCPPSPSTALVCLGPCSDTRMQMAQREALECLSTCSRRVLGYVLSLSTRQEIHLITCEAEDWVWGVDREGLCSREGALPCKTLQFFLLCLTFSSPSPSCPLRLTFPFDVSTRCPSLSPLGPPSFHFLPFYAYCFFFPGLHLPSLCPPVSLSPSTICVILSYVKLHFQSDLVSHFFLSLLSEPYLFFPIHLSFYIFCLEHRGH